MKTPLPLLVAAAWLVVLAGACLAPAQEPDARFTHYDQWKLALQGGAVADPRAITAPPGFTVEMIRFAGRDDGSWISLAFDRRDRLIVGREDRGLLRLTLAADHRSVPEIETVNDTLLEPRGLLFVKGNLYVTANNSKGFYRLRDFSGNGDFAPAELLLDLPGGVGHGRNGMALGPDGKIYLALGNNVRLPFGYDTGGRLYTHFALDRLLPCAWNDLLFDADAVPPAGFIARTDADGKQWELVAGGFRNPYSLDFNEQGELFTYDADMERDVGAPWYRPTRVIHVVPGGEYGWRQGASVWPDQFADMLPGVVDIGLGSPTGVKFGTKSHFPPPYRQALFILDWAYGRILAVHLQQQGATYTGRAEVFLSGRPLNVTDMVFGPDGAMYFTVGGRRTQSALYRVSYTGNASPPASVPAPQPPQRVIVRQGDTAKILSEAKRAAPQTPADGNSEYLRQRRLGLERLYNQENPDNVELAWSPVGLQDRWVRFAARTAIELQPVTQWKQQALAETTPAAAVGALLALARVGPADARAPLLARLNELLSSGLPDAERLVALRAYQLAMIRMPVPEPVAGDRPSATEAAQIRAVLEPLYPAASFGENQLLSELLVYLGSPAVVGRSLDLLDAARAQPEQLWYLFVLRSVDQPWTLEQRRRYFAWLKRAEAFDNVMAMRQFVTYIRTDALWSLAPAEREALAPQIAQLGTSTASPPTVIHRPFVRSWTLDELLPSLAEVASGRDLARGQALFTQALCIHCHRLGGAGGALGPDLSVVSARFGRRDLLESILLPSKVVEGKYRDVRIETDDGRMLGGQIVGADATSLGVAENPSRPTDVTRIPRSSIVARTTSPVSAMPEGLLNTLSRDEILDLLAYLESSGRPAP